MQIDGFYYDESIENYILLDVNPQMDYFSNYVEERNQKFKQTFKQTII
jgi:hypothetical protein